VVLVPGEEHAEEVLRERDVSCGELPVPVGEHGADLRQARDPAGARARGRPAARPRRRSIRRARRTEAASVGGSAAGGIGAARAGLAMRSSSARRGGGVTPGSSHRPPHPRAPGCRSESRPLSGRSERPRTPPPRARQRQSDSGMSTRRVVALTSALLPLSSPRRAGGRGRRPLRARPRVLRPRRAGAPQGPVRMQATRLGSYLLYTKDRRFVTAAGVAAARATPPTSPWRATTRRGTR
jgi:hypothetical protein